MLLELGLDQSVEVLAFVAEQRDQGAVFATEQVGHAMLHGVLHEGFGQHAQFDPVLNPVELLVARGVVEDTVPRQRRRVDHVLVPAGETDDRHVLDLVALGVQDLQSVAREVEDQGVAQHQEGQEHGRDAEPIRQAVAPVVPRLDLHVRGATENAWQRLLPGYEVFHLVFRVPVAQQVPQRPVLQVPRLLAITHEPGQDTTQA